MILLVLAACIPDGAWDLRQPHWADISLKNHHLCALRQDGTVRCFFDGNNARVEALSDIVSVKVSGQDEFAMCALDADGTAHCIGDGMDSVEVPDGPFTQVEIGEGLACGIRDDRSMECWGDALYDSSPPDVGWWPSEVDDLIVSGTNIDVVSDGRFLWSGHRADELDGIDIVDADRNYDGWMVTDADGHGWLGDYYKDWERVTTDVLEEPRVGPTGDFVCGIADRHVACAGSVQEDLELLPLYEVRQVELGGDNIIGRGAAITIEGHLVTWGELSPN